MLVAAVRRVRQPGVKFDEMLVLESKQGTNKSSALRVLATRDEWFIADLPLNAESKVVIERLAGRWIAEEADLNGKNGRAHHRTPHTNAHHFCLLLLEKKKRHTTVSTLADSLQHPKQ